VLASDPKSATALNYLGYMMADRGTRLDESLALIRRAVALDPQKWRLSRLARLGPLQDGQVRSGRSRAAQGRGSHGQRSDGARASGRRLPENQSPEAGGIHGSARYRSGRRPFPPKLRPPTSPRSRRNSMGAKVKTRTQAGRERGKVKLSVSKQPLSRRARHKAADPAAFVLRRFNSVSHCA